ncbi:MAG TPA: sigma-54-dependent Fis family transcriptional regulator [Chromatiales bacterium]|nr:sigma-54-dependent Fis family transcriptional regulator [Chromatiales bacterium]
MRKNIYFIDDDVRAGELFQRFATDAGYKVSVFQSPEKALDAFAADVVDLVITDLKMPGLSGTELLAEIRKQDSEIPVIIITGFSTVEHAIEALRLGATDFLKKPYDVEELLLQIDRVLESRALKTENKQLKNELARARGDAKMIGETPGMLALKELIHKVADIRCNVIIYGESGTGKELVARGLHEQGQYAEQPFIVIDCGALTDTLLESELFGHEKGAFTGADQQRIGLLESASGGTVFLDEICNISDAMQTKLLRVVQEQQITRVGGVKAIDIDVRFITATNRDIEAMIAAGEFRHDLYHRLNVVRIDVPPLRERREDIPLLVQHFIQQFNQRYGRKVSGFTSEAMEQLMTYDWPGNVRELQNLIERHVALVDEAVMPLQSALMAPTSQVCSTTSIDHDNPDLRTLEQRYIEKTLQRFNGSREKTAKALGMNKSTLWRKLQQYGQQ